MSVSNLTINSKLPLHNSPHRIPVLGFGVYQSPEHKCVESCKIAFTAGYRHVDTAQYYANEKAVGRAIRESRVSRSDIFVTTKILSPGNDVESTYKKIKESVEKLDGATGYVDLCLIHSPNGGKESRRLMWEALVKAKGEGKVRDIGVSNYGIGHIEEIKEFSKEWPPVVNQIELHPWCQQREIVSYCQRNNIVIEAYCPLVRNEKAHDRVLQSISAKHFGNIDNTNRVLVRWSLQKGWVPLPKSDTATRIESNAKVYDFQLDEEDVERLDDLDQGDKGALVQAVKNEV
ncbi:NADP-dependent oxidoreductase domain-containing protein [Lophiotrema nucula]|uniref:NADP-dependent oxidoreductase domain-containing protein n=1 Tax=Lophiotrema nucula TaxID=690887 RepID=A0A6A5YP12_9PLEO|nr:NADP-dependent oxidoreductase domain-containing protein [Lophiotrema nucula]